MIFLGGKRYFAIVNPHWNYLWLLFYDFIILIKFWVDNTNQYKLRKNTDFVVPYVNTVHFGKDSLQYFGSVIRKLISENIMQWTPSI